MTPEIMDSEIVESETQALAIIPRNMDLTIQREPSIVLTEAHKAAAALKGVIDAKPRKVVFNGKTFLENEDWNLVARFYGVAAKTGDAEWVKYGEGEEAVTGFKARAIAFRISDGQELSTAESLCLSDEPTWANKPTYQRSSMAQTRAQSKVLRQMFSWVVVLAGYAPTPAEEMVLTDNGAPAIPLPKATAAPATAGTPIPKSAISTLKSAVVMGDSDAIVTKVVTVVKEGKRPWIAVAEADGREYQTFDAKLADTLQQAHTQQSPVRITYTTVVNGKFTNLTISRVEPMQDGDDLLPY